MKKIKVLYIMSSIGIGGYRESLLMLLDRLAKDKFERIIVCPERGALTEELERAGERVIIIKGKSRFGLLSLFKLARVLKKEKAADANITSTASESITKRNRPP